MMLTALGFSWPNFLISILVSDERGNNHLRGGYITIYGRGNRCISLLQAATNILKIASMSASMARQGGRVQLEPSNMHLAMNMAKMSKGRFPNSVIEHTQSLNSNPCTEVWEENNRGVEFPSHTMNKAVIGRPAAMLRQYHRAAWHPWPNGTTMNPQPRLRCKGISAHPPAWPRWPVQSLPETPPAPAGNNSRVEHS